MPRLRGLTAHVTDSRGKDLQEWGIQYLRRHTEGNRVSAYVQSTTDVSFEVSLQPEIPFTRHFPPSDTSGGDHDSPGNNPRRLKAGSEESSIDQDREKMSNNTLSSTVRSSGNPQSHSAPDFAFLAALYLDGRKTPERKIIVYLDPADKDFSSPDGKVSFRHRRVQSADGRMTEKAWVFKEKAIETAFDKLMIAGSQVKVEDQDDDALIEAMESSGFDAQGKMEKESKVGQIVVELRRVILGKQRTVANYRSHHQEGQDEDITMEGVRREITHATGFIHRKTLDSQPLRVVDYWPYKPNEGLYATFQFFYRSREQLQQLQFPGFSPLPTTVTPKTTRLLNARMANLTPLSISLPLKQKTRNILRDQDSYEAKVKREGFKPDDGRKYHFGSEYRDKQAISPSAVDEAHNGKMPPKFEAAPLPFLVNKPLENATIDPFALETSPTTAEPPFWAGQAVASDLKSKLQAQGHARQSFNPDTPASVTAKPSSSPPSSPASVTAKPSSSPPSSTDFTKEQVAHVTDKDEDGYRPTAGDSYPSDQEQDADDELVTESDLETHAGDDDFPYAAHPEEEDNDYDDLQSQFQNVRIRKRQRDDVDDPEDDDGAGQVGDAARPDGDGKREDLTLPLAEEERPHRGKKSRTAKADSVGAPDTQEVQGGGVTSEGMS